MSQNLKSSFRKPPYWFRLLNQAWKSSYFLGTEIRLDKDDLIKTARKMTGLHELGKDFHDEPLERLVRSINEEARLHPAGRFITKQRFASLLAIRLRAEYFFKKYTEILSREIYPAWFIIGLQRTGTTKLQRLLATDPDHRVIPSWEVINPVPLDLEYMEKLRAYQSAVSSQQPTISPPLPPSPIGEGTGVGLRGYPLPSDKRINVARTSVKAVKLISPGFFAVHPIDILQPEEDILLLDVSFMSTTPEAMMNVPSYSSWLENTDQSEAYAYMVRLLKFLQWINPAKRWILKSPHHLEFPDIIEKNFGEVRFLWPHRTIYESVPSFLSMVTYNHMIFSDSVDPGQITSHWVRKTGYMLDKAISYRSKQGNDAKFIDIGYKDLISDSIGELSKIYRQNGGLTLGQTDRIRQHEIENPHRKHGVHQYSMADFGLTEADIDRHTSHYKEFLAGLTGRK